MRILILKDEIIKTSSHKKVVKEVSDIFIKNADITPEVTVREVNHAGAEGISRHLFDSLPYGYVKQWVDRIHKEDAGRYDHIIFMVHRDNWIFQEKKVWGENFSNFFYDYHVELVRFDNRNLANSTGTTWHEIHHSLDAIIETELGVKVEDSFRAEVDEKGEYVEGGLEVFDGGNWVKYTG